MALNFSFLIMALIGCSNMFQPLSEEDFVAHQSEDCVEIFDVLPESVNDKLIEDIIKKYSGDGDDGLFSLRYNESVVYNREEQKEMVTSSRVSKHMTSDDSWMFDFIQNHLIQNLTFEGYDISLIRDHWDIILYEDGGYFNKHRDFIKVKSGVSKIFSGI